MCDNCGRIFINEDKFGTMPEALFQPFTYNGELVIEVECGTNVGWLFISKLCQGSKGASILFQDVWFTPNEFQFISGRETAKDWKRSIRHKGRSLKLLMAKGFFNFHPSVCTCKRVFPETVCQQQSAEWISIQSSSSSHVENKTELESSAKLSENNNDAITQASPETFNPPLSSKLNSQDSRIQKMEIGHKASNSPEPRKESRLTSIIDQLRINKAKDVTQSDQKSKSNEKTRLNTPWQQQTETNVPTEVIPAMPTDALASAAPKTERGSPEPESSSSPSLSPHSPSPARAFPSLLVPGFGLAALRVSSAPQFSPPGLERFSPATANPAIKQMEMMTRNYSDFMRSLAAKYNQNNAQDSFSMPQSNGFVRGFDSTFPFKGSSTPFFVRNMDVEGNGGSGLPSGLSRKVDNQSSPTPAESRNNNNNNITNNVLNSSAPGGLSDFSSSQTLLNLVRTASAQSASQLENYLKGAVKRSADGESRVDPLDLTVGNIKRPKLESAIGLRDNLLQNEVDGSDGSAKTSSSVSASKPSWLSLMDRRMHSSPTSSSRTSPKIQNSERSRCASLCIDKSCTSQSEASDLSHWTVDDVVKFVSSVETCSEYAEKFRDESIDGTTLPLLTEDHLTMHMGLKLGPALKLRSTLARRIGHCAVCMHCVHCHGEDNPDIRRHESSRSPTVSK